MVKKANANANSRPTKPTKGFYDDSESESEKEEGEQEMEEIVILDPDLELLLKSCQPLLQSRNAAVIIAVARTYLYLGTEAYLETAIGPLIALLRSASDVQHIALYNIVQVCLSHPEPFVKYYTHFLVRSTDAPHIWQLKLELLTLIFPYAPSRLQSLVLAELSHFSHSGSLDPGLVKEAVRAIGRCAQSSATSPKTSARCLRLLLAHIGSADAPLVAESLEVIRHLIQRDPENHRTTVIRLAKHLDAATSPQARASIIWLVGEFAGLDPENNIAADVLRILVKNFANEAEPAKHQIVLLAAKVYVHYLNANPPPAEKAPEPETIPKSSPLLEGFQDEGGFADPHLETSPEKESTPENEPEKHQIEQIYEYIQLLVRYDTSYDLRDRARVYRAFLATPSSTQLASLLLLAPKPVPQTPSPSETRKNYTLGSASLVIGDEGGIAGLKGYEPIPPWVKEGREPDPSCREERVEREYEPEAVRVAGMSAAQRLDAAAVGSSFAASSPGSGSGINGVGAASGKGKEKTLDDWLAEEEEEETDSEEEGSTEYETDSEEEEEEEESEDEENEGAKLVK